MIRACHISTNRINLVLLACGCARLCLKYSEWPQPLKAIEAAEAWTRGEATVDEVKAAAVESARHGCNIGYSAFSDAASSAYNAALTVYTDDPMDSVSRAIDYCAFAYRDETLKKCAPITAKYGFRLFASCDPFQTVKLEQI